MKLQTESLLIQTLCVPCGCRCRYCLLSCDGRAEGADWDRSAALARRYRERLRRSRPSLQVSFAFGSCMEHPDIPGALAVLRELGSPQAEFWQCDGMRLRSEAECRALAELLAREGVKKLNFTLYGLEDYHDCFAGRAGDFRGNLRLMEAAGRAGLAVSCGVPLTLESVPQVEALAFLLQSCGLCGKLFFFVPHEEGRGKNLSAIRVTAEALATLPAELAGLLNRRLYRTEGEWIRERAFVPETRRSLLLSLRVEDISRWEAMEPEAAVEELEALDEAYYAAFPPLEALAERYGDPHSDRLYRQRDLFHHYRRLYAAAFGGAPYDVTDERRSGSRRE